MALREICKYPHPSLNTVCEAIAEINGEILDLSSDMIETMYAANGLGLAANQVGETRRLIVVEADPEGERSSPMVLINPRITQSEGSLTWEEGCLSVPGFYPNVTRFQAVVCEALDKEGKPVTIETEGVLALCLQHELDHLDGKTLLDRISSLKRALYKKKLKKGLVSQEQN